jgi:hypothetical protein
MIAERRHEADAPGAEGRRAEIVSRQDLGQRPDIADTAPDRTGDLEVEEDFRQAETAPHRAHRGLEANDAAMRRRPADGPSSVGRQGERTAPGGNRRGCPA